MNLKCPAWELTDLRRYRHTELELKMATTVLQSMLLWMTCSFLLLIGSIQLSDNNNIFNSGVREEKTHVFLTFNVKKTKQYHGLRY